MKTSIKKLLSVAALTVAAVVVSSTASATSYLDATSVATATTNVTDTITNVQSATFPLIMLSTGIAVAFALFKKFVSKAA